MAAARLLPSAACTLKRVQSIGLDHLCNLGASETNSDRLAMTDTEIAVGEHFEDGNGFTFERYDVSVSDQAVVSTSGSPALESSADCCQKGGAVQVEAGRRVSLDSLPSEGRRLSRGGDPSPIMKQSEGEESVAAKTIRLLLRPLEWKPPPDRSFPLTGGEIINLCMQTEALVEKESSCLKVQAPVKVFGDVHGQYADLMRLFAAYGSPPKLDANGDISAYDYLFLGELRALTFASQSFANLHLELSLQ